MNRFKTVVRFILISVLFLATIGWFGQALAASADQLRFYGEPPQLQYKEILGNLWKIYVEGVIDIDAATRLEKYLHENAIPGRSLVFLNSSGGNLIGGMNLGRVHTSGLKRQQVAHYCL